MKLCLGCMKEIEDDAHICPFCGYEEGRKPTSAYYLTPGTLLNHRYLIGKVLGSGGFGVTYIGKDTVLNWTVAVKEYFPGDFATRRQGSRDIEIYSGGAEASFLAGLDSYLSEARRLAQINEVNGIVHVHDYFQENNTGYIVMEYLKGRTIKEILDGGKKYSWDEAKTIIKPVLEALSEVHKAGMIHRDIAPDNIFITDKKTIKILDFGAARYAATNMSKSLSVIVKSGYSPEEQYRVNGKQGPWTDVYGVGATFYRMITGFHPEEALERIIEDKIVPPSKAGVNISPAQEKVLMKSLSVKSKDRYQSADEFLKDLFYERPIPSVPAKYLIAAGICGGILIFAGAFIGGQISSGGKSLNSKTESITGTENAADSISTADTPDTSTAENTSDSTETVSDSKTDADILTLNLAVNGEQHAVEIENVTEMKIQEIYITRIWKDEQITFDKESIQSGEPPAAEIEDNQIYQLEISNTDSGEKMYFYNLNLSVMENLKLYNWDGYTYAVYKDRETGQEISQIQYRAMTWDEMQIRYALVGLNVRSLPDEQNGQILERYSSRKKIRIYGQAVGLTEGQESFWYLVHADGKIGYISADEKYTSVETPPALTATPVLQQNSASADSSSSVSANSSTGAVSYKTVTAAPTVTDSAEGTANGTENGTDSGTGSSTDNGTGTGTEGGTETGTDNGTENGTDSGTGSSTDSGTGTSTDNGTETGDIS